MKPRSYRLSIAGIAAGALCLALAGGPALADPADDENESGKVRIYEEGSEPLKDGEVRITQEEDSTPPPAPMVRKETRVQENDDEDLPAPGGYLGVSVQDVTRELQKARDLPRAEGALVNRVESGSPAYQAGIRRGDVIIELDGDNIDKSSDLISGVQGIDPGKKVKVVVLRNGGRKTFSVTLGKRPKEFMSPRSFRWMEHYGDNPGMPPMGEQLDRIRVYRQDIQKQLNDIQEQLTRLREGDLQRLEDEIRALREELRARDEGQKPRTN
jgi:membrane-associated protease RseP (regulator of RpoE activity)